LLHKEWNMNQTVWKVGPSPYYGLPVLAKVHRNSWLNTMAPGRSYSYLSKADSVVVAVGDNVRLRVI